MGADIPHCGPFATALLTNGAQYVTVNEAREANSLPPLDSALGDAKTLRGPVQTCVDAECELCGVLFKGRPTIIDSEDLWLCSVCSADVQPQRDRFKEQLQQIRHSTGRLSKSCPATLNEGEAVIPRVRAMDRYKKTRERLSRSGLW